MSKQRPTPNPYQRQQERHAKDWRNYWLLEGIVGFFALLASLFLRR